MTPRQRKALDTLRDELARREGGYCTVPVTTLRTAVALLDALLKAVPTLEPAPQ